MIEQTSQRSQRIERRRRLSRARRNSVIARRAFERVVARFGFHALVMAVGLSVALTVWSNPRAPLELRDQVADAVLDTLSDGDEGARDGAEASFVGMAAIEPTAEPLKPMVRTVAEGDTIRTIAAEYSVSISTILASNRIEDPDLITPGQELLIPPVEGVVAEIESGETIAKLAERYGADPLEIAKANGMSADPEQTIPYERLIVPGLESAERGAQPGHRRPAVAANARAEVDASELSQASGVSYEVQEGDTLAQLSAQFGVSVWTILTANNIAEPDMLQPGTKLKVLPVNGIEHEVQDGESLVDIASFYEVDLGPLVDFNAISDPNNLKVGMKLTIPGAERTQPGISLASIGAPAVVAQAPQTVTAPQQTTASQQTAASQRPSQGVAVAQKPAVRTTLAQAAPKPQAPTTAQAQPRVAAKPQAPAQNRLAAASATTAQAIPPSGRNAGGVVGTAMRYLGSRYVFGGTSPAGFDCSGFVWYVHNAAGRPVSRGLWGQMNGGPRVPQSALQPGDTVFFANTYMPGLSHAGIYVGGGRFIHASDESSGVKISSLSDGYWGPRYIGASRLN
jgi:peptidoglycan endopeptidase LytE